MEIYILIIINVLLMGMVGFLVYRTRRLQRDDDPEFLLSNIRQMLEQNEKMTMMLSKSNTDALRNEMQNNISFQIEQLKTMAHQIEVLTQMNSQRLENVTNTIERNLHKLQEDNEKKLEQMRQTVDEKLNTTLEQRLNQSFALISKNLDAVQLGLGEMRSLASGVGDLKKVLSNVKTRGTLAEVQLGNLLEQMLVHSQYDSQVLIKPDEKSKDNKVDYVIKLPGKDDGEMYLPIDAKFPLEDYQRLVEASENGNFEDIEKYSKALDAAVKKEAISISTKYIMPPKTTDFGIMYLALEGLYAEVVKKPGMMEMLQQNYKILVCGPSTLSGLLNSLQMGFKTLAIEKRSSEIWALLGMFKKEFGTFVDLLGKTQKQLNTAGNTIEEATRKSKVIARKLDRVAIDEPEPVTLLDDDIIGSDENE